MKKCPTCKTENSDDTKFCKNCGSNISSTPPNNTVVKCPECGNLSPSGTRFCGACAQPLTQEAANQLDRQRFPVYVETPKAKTHPATVVLTIIIVIVALMIVAPKSCTIPLATITADIVTPQPTKAALTTVTTKSSEGSIAKIGEEIHVGKVSYVVEKVELAETVGGDYLNVTAKGIYLLVYISITNGSGEPITISDSFFTILHGERTFAADSTATLYVDSENSLWYDSLNPDLTTTGVIAFDVSNNVANSFNTLLQVQTGFWGTQTGIISLAR